jgi:predicted ATPase/DNA-binding SARP family transcriptional activator
MRRVACPPLRGWLRSRAVTGPACRFGVLGPLLFERDSSVVTVPAGRQRSLLALLLWADGAPLSRDRLVDELWGDRAPASAVSALHVHMSKLRALLGDLLVHESGGYILKTSDCALDLREFESLIEQARAEPEKSRALLTEALAVFRGEPLGDVDAERTVGRWRSELEEKRLQALMSRIDADLEGGLAAELLPELGRLISEHQYEERLWGQLMLASYRAGRQADALAVFQRARSLFARELGLDPGEPLAALHRRILDQDPSLLVAREARTPHPRAERAASTLPRPLTRLVGRDHELADLGALLVDPDVRLVTMTGTGGVGKTRLLLELASEEESRHADGALFVALDAVDDPALVAAEVATALAQRDRSEGLSADGLMRYLRDRDLLLALDNYEHLLAAAPLVSELLASSPGLRVLVSSRIPLGLRGEHLFDVEPLALPQDAGDVAAAESPAVQLFLQSALASNRRLEIDGQTAQTAARICGALDGLPLAIELAAARSNTLSPDQIEAQLAQPLSIGEHALRDLPDRQQTLEATIRWSYDLLSPGAQAALRAAGAFLGGFTPNALEAVVGDPVQGELRELLHANLIRKQPEEDRFTLLELIRAFALVQLEAADETQSVRERHRRYFAAHVKAASDALDERGSSAALSSPLRPDHANIRAALEDAFEQGDQESAFELALGLRPLWYTDLLRHEAHDVIDRLFTRFAVTDQQEIALLKAGAFVTGFGPSAAGWLERLAARAAEAGDRASYEVAICNQFMMAGNARDREAVNRLRPALLALITPETSAKTLGWVHYYLANDAYAEGRMEQAVEHASRSAEIAEEIGHDYLLGSAHCTRLLAQSARDGAIPQVALAELLEMTGRTMVKTDVVYALWFVARYAAAVEPASAGRWLALAEPIRAEFDLEIWPEGELRDETMAILGIDDLAPLLAATEPLDHAAAFAEAAAWLAGRDPTEQTPRERSARVATGAA